MSRDRESYGILLQILRTCVRFFSGFCLFIVAVVAWRKLWVGGLGIHELERGELISLALLLALAIALFILSTRVQREIDRNA